MAPLSCRLFVSSTFSDFTAERYTLDARVFPAVAARMSGLGITLTVADLRFGIDDRDSHSHSTVDICLGEVQRCRREAPPGPHGGPSLFFMLLTGNRYGWRPLPTRIGARRFAEFQDALDDRCRQLLGEWYELDENADPAHFVLRPRTGEFLGWDAWAHVEDELRAALGIERSITHLEVDQSGILTSAAARHGALVFARDLDGCASASPLYADPTQDRIRAFREDVLSKMPASKVFSYAARWVGDGGAPAPEVPAGHGGGTQRTMPIVPHTIDHLDQFAEDAIASICESLQGAVDHASQVGALAREVDTHAAFAHHRTRVFVGQQDVLQAIAQYVAGPSHEPYLLYGPSGCGKTSILAQTVEKVRHNNKFRGSLVARFVGASPRSTDLQTLLADICNELAGIAQALEASASAADSLLSPPSSTARGRSVSPGRRRGRSREPQARSASPSAKAAVDVDLANLPTDAPGLARVLPALLEQAASAQSPLVLLIDSLDQLSGAHNSQTMDWLPLVLPRHVKVILSAIPGTSQEILTGALPPTNVAKLSPMGTAHSVEILDALLAKSSRLLQEEQRRVLMASVGESALPLYVKLVFERCRKWPSSFAPPKQLPADVPEMIDSLFASLVDDEHHPGLLVRRLLGLLAASTSGLSVDELVDVLSRDDDVWQLVMSTSYHKLSDRRMPMMPVSRILESLRPYLASRRGESGVPLISAYHRQVSEALARRYLGDAREREHLHRALAEYFGTVSSPRRFAEEPRQWLAARDFEQLARRCLVNLEYVAAACRAGFAHATLQLYSEAISAIEHPTPVRRDFEAMQRFVGTALQGLMAGADIYALAYNTPDSSRPHALARELPEPELWLRLENKQATTSPCLLTLTGHRAAVTACAIAAPERCISVAEDASIRLWNLVTGEALYVVTNAHSQRILYCDIATTSRRVLVTCSSGAEFGAHTAWREARGQSGATVGAASGELRLWAVDLEQSTIKLLRCLNEGAPQQYVACAISNDASWVAAGTEDGRLLVVSASSGEVIRELEGFHTLSVSKVLFDGDGRRVFSSSADSTIAVWSWMAGADAAISIRHQGRGIRDLALNSSERLIASGAPDKMARVMALGSDDAHLISTYSDHKGTVNVVEFSPFDSGILMTGAAKMAKLVRVDSSGGDFDDAKACVRYLQGHTGAVLCGRFASERVLVTTSLDRSLKVWEIPTQAERTRRKQEVESVPTASHIRAMCISPSRKYVCAGASRAYLAVMSGDATLAMRPPTTRSSYTVMGLAWSREGTRVAVGGSDGRIRVHTVHCPLLGRFLRSESGAGSFAEPIKEGVVEYEMHRDEVMEVDFLPGGLVVSVSKDKLVHVSDPVTGQSTMRFGGHSATIKCVAVSPTDNDIFATCGEDYKVKMWSIRGQRELVRFRRASMNKSVNAVAFNPSGTLVAFGGASRTVQVWTVETGQCLWDLHGPKGTIQGVGFVDDQTVTATSLDKTVYVWRLAETIAEATERGEWEPVDTPTISSALPEAGRTLAAHRGLIGVGCSCGHVRMFSLCGRDEPDGDGEKQ